MQKIITIILLSTLSACVQPESTVSSLEGNNSPVVQSISVDPVSITVGSSSVLKVTASDPDGDALSYSWSSALGDIIGSGAEVRYTAAFCCVGLNTINVVVSDTRGGKVSKDVRVEINP